MIQPIIIGGATVWARKSVDSDIFCEKPHVWFKIWFYLVNRVNHVSNKNFDRGECFLKYEWIREKTGASTDQIKKCIAYLRESTMISTTKKTRGTVIKVLKYDFYQTLDNYYSDVKSDISTTESTSRSTTEAPQKHHRSTTINKNDKNDKNDKNINTNTILCEQGSREETQVNEVIKMFETVNPSYEKMYPNKTQRSAAARLLKKWTIHQIQAVVSILPKLNADQYAKGKSITPLQLEDNLGYIKAFIDKTRDNSIRKA